MNIMIDGKKRKFYSQTELALLKPRNPNRRTEMVSEILQNKKYGDITKIGNVLGKTQKWVNEGLRSGSFERVEKIYLAWKNL